ncbi:MAG: hypothetical protein IKM48_07100 [Clostridia bacterium]|nr:hypothetical protein [Clostridia bacterium]
MENFIEYCLPYKMTAADQLKRAVYTVAPMVLGVFLIMYLGPIGILLCGGLCYLAYWLFLSFNYELEYSLLENELTFTRIINKERRREMCKADIAKTVSYGPMENMPKNQQKVRSFLSNQGEEPAYYWITLDKKGEKVCILFQPTPAVLEVFAVRARGKLR